MTALEAHYALQFCVCMHCGNKAAAPWLVHKLLDLQWSTTTKQQKAYTLTKWTRWLKNQTKISRSSQKNKPKMNFSGKTSCFFFKVVLHQNTTLAYTRSDLTWDLAESYIHGRVVYESGRAEFSAIHTVDKRGVWCLTWNLSASYARVQIDKCQTCVRVAIHTAFCHMYCW